ncbi:hypothetical protein J3459_010902 [Metarhizium acridum]|uniref:Hydrophobin n=1 Tax=Metarhizium acridum (strain CQMa 102) TaxID=655827 RepID=E9EBT2_METAQ|nr:Hydrophobin-like protein ssgA [Metarhizium acridum CQMa 102]EFY86641.1 Hydrophobin-like protein ssgA [Metarhizium acridum CQMa 102]KAG8408585.1 hypothetical protein J3458_019616 [Metarhizium acridum]KAG8420618.1 hypothetical protein J3459_010902 [Metarhizium acridum]
MFKALIVALAAVAVAIPTYPQPSNNNVNQCGNGAEVYCCNKEEINQFTGLIPVSALNNLVGGGACNKLDVSAIIGVTDLLNNGCTQQTVCCNDVYQNGLVNVACSPINV